MGPTRISAEMKDTKLLAHRGIDVGSHDQEQAGAHCDSRDKQVWSIEGNTCASRAFSYGL